MGLQSKRTGQVVRGLLIRRGAAGDGLVALSATLILPVQTHWAAGRAVAGQWIYAKQSHAATDRKGDKQARQIQPLNAQPAAQPCEETWGLASTPTGWRRHRHRSRGRATLPATLTPAPERRAAAAGRCRPRPSRGTMKDGRCRTELFGVCRALRRGRYQVRAHEAEQSEPIGAPCTQRGCGLLLEPLFGPRPIKGSSLSLE
jgi:hypothetical protein